jgi:hypothetical protein
MSIFGDGVAGPILVAVMGVVALAVVFARRNRHLAPAT